MPNSHLPAAPAVSLLILCSSELHALHQMLNRARTQSLTDCEVLLLIPAGCDVCDSVLHSAGTSPLRVLRCTQPGQSAAWNAGMDASRGSYVAFIDQGFVPDQDFALRLYTQALLENAELCHGEYAVAGYNVLLRSCHGALSRTAGSPLLCLGPLWTTLFKRSFLMEHQLRFRETFSAGGAELVFHAMALLSCKRLALCEYRVAQSTIQGHARELTAPAVNSYVAAYQEIAAQLTGLQDNLHPQGLSYAWAWLITELKKLLALNAQSATIRTACQGFIRKLHTACPPAAGKLLEQQLLLQGCGNATGTQSMTLLQSDYLLAISSHKAPPQDCSGDAAAPLPSNTPGAA